jgi:hypothetical protein
MGSQMFIEAVMISLVEQINILFVQEAGLILDQGLWFV